MTISDPVPPQARTELERLDRRWRQLPLGQALAHVQDVLTLAQRYADAAGDVQDSQYDCSDSCEPVALPDLGPAVVIDQLTVTAYDLAVLDPASELAGAMAADLAALRRRIA